MNSSYQDRRDRQIAHRAALECFDYEISKKRKEIDGLRSAANRHYQAGRRAEAAECQRQIKNLDERISFLKHKRCEVDERESEYRENEASEEYLNDYGD